MVSTMTTRKSREGAIIRDNGDRTAGALRLTMPSFPRTGDESRVHPVRVVGGDAVSGVGDDEPQLLEAGVQLQIESPGAQRLVG